MSDPLRPDQKEMVRRLRRDPQRTVLSVGWYCGNCKNWHSPEIHTCPEPPKGGSLRERIKEVHNG